MIFPPSSSLLSSSLDVQFPGGGVDEEEESLFRNFPEILDFPKQVIIIIQESPETPKTQAAERISKKASWLNPKGVSCCFSFCVTLLPEKAEGLNLRRDFGIVPVSLLLDRSICLRFGRSRSGMSPENELFARFKTLSLVKREREEGMLPLNPLLERSRTLRFFNSEKIAGNGPERWLCCR